MEDRKRRERGRKGGERGREWGERRWEEEERKRGKGKEGGEGEILNIHYNSKHLYMF